MATKSVLSGRSSVLGNRKSSVLGTRSPAAGEATPAAPATTSAKKNPLSGLDFIGNFPVKRNSNEKKNEQKKQPTGPVFKKGEYKIASRNTILSNAITEEFNSAFLGKYKKDKVEILSIAENTDHNEAYLNETPYEQHRRLLTRDTFEALLNKEIDMAVHNMKEIPLELPEGLIIGAALNREDPRDAMITRSTFGAIQELPMNAVIGARSQRRIMQIRHLRPDLKIVPTHGPLNSRILELDNGNLDALVVSWAGLRRLNISPRYYVALQPEQMLPSPCQGIIGIVCRKDDKDLVQKLHYIEDSESSWASRCERAFLSKFGEFGDSPVGANAHRKGTQDPWILDTVIGDAQTGEILRHREIGTSRCKPESLADKAFTGIVSKGARKYFPFSGLRYNA